MANTIKPESFKSENLKVTLVKSLIGTIASHRACVRGLGLGRIGSTAVVENTPSVRGMIGHVSYLVKCEGVPICN